MLYVRTNMRVPSGVRKLLLDSKIGGTIILALMFLALAHEAPAQIRVVATDAVQQSAVFAVDGDLLIVTAGGGIGRSAFRLMHITESGALISTASSKNGLSYRFVLRVGDSLPSDASESEHHREPAQTLFRNKDRLSQFGGLE